MNTNSIAIVGMACRYPDSDGPQELWENVLTKRRAFRRIPSERMSHGDYIVENGGVDTTYCQKASVLSNYHFDRLKYRITGKAFRSTDMAHWLALDVAHGALMDAGFDDLEKALRQRTGVLVGNTLTGEFSRSSLMRLRWPYVKDAIEQTLQEENLDFPQLDEWLLALEDRYKEPFEEIGEDSLAGALSNTIAGRICNHFDFGGGGYTLDGACCSSLLAVANGCSALSQNDIDIAIVGGVDLSLDPLEMVGFARLDALAREDMRVYDAQPTGFWPGEGCGFVVLMRAEDAAKRNCKTYGYIDGWGISSDGQGGISRPVVDGQRTAIRRAYRKSGVDVTSVDLFEGHGTGTAIGDAVELEALVKERASTVQPESKAVIGSIKANIGHTKAAAGIASLIKVAKAIDARVLPPATGVRQPHSLLKDKNTSLRLLDQAESWNSTREMRAGVSSFGFGGINVHLNVNGTKNTTASAFTPPVRLAESTVQDTELFIFSAADLDSLKTKIDELSDKAAGLSFAELTDLAKYLSDQNVTGRCRAAIIAATPELLVERLAKLSTLLEQGSDYHLDAAAGLFLGDNKCTPNVGFVFPGQAAPVRFSGGALETRFPEIRKYYESIQLEQPQNLADQQVVATEYGQAAIVAAEIAGLKLLTNMGINATHAMGHSLGELTALHWSGAISETNILELARLRGHAMGHVSGVAGTMANLNATTERVTELLGENSDVVIAAINGPDQTVISGPTDKINTIIQLAKTHDIDSTLLSVSHAFHSKLMEPAKTPLAKALNDVQVGPVFNPVYSSVTGQLLEHSTDLRKHLIDQLTQPVLANQSLKLLLDQVDLCIEVGPGSIISNLVKNICDTPIVSLDVGANSVNGYLQAVAASYVCGVNIDIRGLFADRLVRPFDPNHESSYLANACSIHKLGERVTTPAKSSEAKTLKKVVKARSNENPSNESRQHNSSSNPELSIIETLRQLIAEKTELPSELIADDSSLLIDLHLTSITVSQIVANAAKQLGIETPVAPTEFADATLQQIATALEEIEAGGGNQARQANIPEGLSKWIRCFKVELIEQELADSLAPSQVNDATDKTDWTFLGNWADTDREALKSELASLGGKGVIVNLSNQQGDSHLEPLFQTAKQIVDADNNIKYVVICQDELLGGGFAKSLHLEYPNVNTCVMTSKTDENLSSRVVSEIRTCQGFKEIQYTENGTRVVPQLSLVATESAHKTALTESDVLLVSGGGKGIAAESAIKLATESGAKLVLLGRSSPNDDSALAANLQRYSDMGLDFLYHAADVADKESVDQAVTAACKKYGSVTAVLHGAGVNNPVLLKDMTKQDLVATCSTKVDGLANILSSLDSSALRLVISFGSVIGNIGMQGEGHYALADEWLSHVTKQHQEQNPDCRCLTLNWSIWSGVGMGERLGRIEILEQQGITAITPDKGIEVLHQILLSDVSGEVVISGRMPKSATLNLPKADLPLMRFVQSPLLHIGGIELICDAELNVGTDPYLNDHVLEGNRIFPGVMGMEAMAQAAMAVTGNTARPTFSDVEFNLAIVVAGDESLKLRIIAEVQSPGLVKLALRYEQTGFSVDHVTATCHFDRKPLESVHITMPETANEEIYIDPEKDFYGKLQFHTGRFKRLKKYLHLESRSCTFEIDAGDKQPWFAPLLPQSLVLQDPGARDTAIHAVQACIPDLRLIPVGIKSIEFGASHGVAPWRAYAQETSSDGEYFVYDIHVFDVNGEICETWSGLKLKNIKRIEIDDWNPSLLSTCLERGASKLNPSADIRVSMQNGSHSSRRGRHDAIANTLTGEVNTIRHRTDGKPVLVQGDKNISMSHVHDLTLGVCSNSNVACDMEPIVARKEEDWQDLLGRTYGEIADVVSHDTGESTATAATRIWATRECLKKAGDRFDAPLTVVAGQSNDWVSFNSSNNNIMTFVTEVKNSKTPLVFAILVGDSDASV